MDNLNLGAFFPALIINLLMLAGAAGWGRIILSATCGSRNHMPLPILSLVGLSALVFVIASLSFVHLANGMVMTALLIAGLVLLIAGYSGQGGLSRLKAEFADADKTTIALIVLLCVLMLLVAVPSGVFNFHDDFHTYFVPPSRLVDSGALAEPADLLASSAYSSQGLLQAVQVYWLDIAGINSLELFLFVLLLLLTINATGQLLRIPQSIRWLSITLALVASPQFVNVSANYSSSALVAGILYLMIRRFIDGQSCSDQAHYQRFQFVPIALLFAFFISAKGTNLPFALLLLVAFIALSLFCGSKGPRIKQAAALPLLLGLFMLPWLLLPNSPYGEFASRGLNALEQLTDSLTTSSAEQTIGPDETQLELNAKPTQTPISPWQKNLGELFSTKSLFWGANYPAYNTLILIAWLSVLAFAVKTWLVSERPNRTCNTMTAAGIAAIITLGYLFGALVYTNRPDLIVRYSAPAVIGSVPTTLLLAFAYSPRLQWKVRQLNGLQIARQSTELAVLLAAAVCIILFASSFAERFERQVNYHTQVSFPAAYTTGYLSYMNRALSPAREQVLLEAQGKTEPKSRIFTWTATPHHLNFARNRIAAMDTHGAGKLYRLWQDGVSNDQVREFFCDNKIDYMILEFNHGTGTRYNKKPDNFVWHRLMRFATEEKTIAFANAKHSIMTFAIRGCNR